MKRILLVDDDPDFLEALCEVVKEAGFQTETAHDGREALDKIAAQRFDLVVLDIMMPVVNGHQVCQKIKSDPNLRDMPVILLTAVAEHVTSSTYTPYDMLATEADDYLPKPVEPTELLARIQRLL